MGIFPKDRNLARSPDRVELPVRASDFRIPAAELELRLDLFLCAKLTWRSRASLQRLIKDGYVSVAAAGGASRPTRRASQKLRHGARVVVRIPAELRLPEPSKAPFDLAVLFEDEEALAVDKPPHLLVHPSGRHLSDTLIQRVHARYLGDAEHARVPIRLCHRLDRETSGVVLLGKGETNHGRLMQQFERREVEKEYLALVRGEPERDEGMIELPIGPARVSRIHLKMTVRADGLPSRTEWCVLERCGDRALVRCRPLTGRQHQIRVHMDSIGHPLVGDKLYGVDEGLFLRYAAGELTDEDRSVLELDRHALHNHRLRFRSPRSGELREVTSSLPSDLAALLSGRRVTGPLPAGQGAPISIR